jgi:hypothetical protein
MRTPRHTTNVPALLSAGLMAIGSLAPWAYTRTWNASEAVAAPGLPHGGALVLACSVVAALFVLGARPVAARLLGCLAACVAAFVTYRLPGSLTDNGAWQANAAWGAYVSLLGALALIITTRNRVGRAPAAVRAGVRDQGDTQRARRLDLR